MLAEVEKKGNETANKVVGGVRKRLSIRDRTISGQKKGRDFTETQEHVVVEAGIHGGAKARTKTKALSDEKVSRTRKWTESGKIGGAPGSRQKKNTSGRPPPRGPDLAKTRVKRLT